MLVGESGCLNDPDKREVEEVVSSRAVNLDGWSNSGPVELEFMLSFAFLTWIFE